MPNSRSSLRNRRIAAAGQPSASTAIGRILQAARHSLAGLLAAYRGEAAFRQEFWVATVLIPLAFWVGRSWVEVALLVGSVLFVITVELLNSAVEATVDRVSLERHELSKRAKDFASAAVLMALLICGAVWAAALWTRLA